MWRSVVLGFLLLLVVAGPSACGGDRTTGFVIQGEGCAARVRWVAPVGGEGADRVTGAAAFADGTAVVAGSFQGVLPVEDAPGPLVSAGDEDVLVARYDEVGKLMWARRAGGAGQDVAAGVAGLPDGSAIVVGHFEGSATFGAGEPTAQVLESAGAEDIYLARFGPLGALQWARRAGGSGSDQALAVAAFSDGAFAMTGSFSGIARFGAGESSQAMLDATSGSELFVVRYDSAGHLQWARQTAGSLEAVGIGVAALPDGSVVVAGEAAKESSGTDRVLFVARYAEDGTPLWLRRSSGAGAACGEATVAYRDGSVLVVGAFGGTITLGAGEPGETTLTAVGQRDILLARYGADGTLGWAQRAGGAGDDAAAGAATLVGEAALVVGRFEGSATFGEGAEPRTLFSAGSGDAFLALYDAWGRLAWVRRAGGAGDDGALAAAALPVGSAVVVGAFEGTAVFGAGEAREQELKGVGPRDGFVLEVGP